MLTQVEVAGKPRLSYAEFVAQQKPQDQERSVAWVIERYIVVMNGLGSEPPIKVLGGSQLYTLRRLQRSPIGKCTASALTRHDVIAHCQMRKLGGVKPQTVMQDVTYLTGALKYAGSAWDDCEDVSDAALAAAKPFLVKHGLISKSVPRTRVPTQDEKDRLVAYFRNHPKTRHKRIDAMPDIVDFAIKSTRRISEIMRIDRLTDIDWDHLDEKGRAAPIYWVRDMKHPTKKKGNDKAFPLFPELAEIIKRQPEHPTDTRVFPYNSKSAGAKYTRAKKVLGIEDLHFHDCRRRGITTALKTMTPHQVRHFYSGHNNTTILERVYDATPADEGFAARAAA